LLCDTAPRPTPPPPLIPGPDRTQSRHSSAHTCTIRGVIEVSGNCWACQFAAVVRHGSRSGKQDITLSHPRQNNLRMREKFTGLKYQSKRITGQLQRHQILCLEIRMATQGMCTGGLGTLKTWRSPDRFEFHHKTPVGYIVGLCGWRGALLLCLVAALCHSA
jgi:hypothetical protein